jgi:hypothetical protein
LSLICEDTVQKIEMGPDIKRWILCRSALG